MIFECTGLCTLTIARRTARESNVVLYIPVLSAIELLVSQSQTITGRRVWSTAHIRLVPGVGDN